MSKILLGIQPTGRLHTGYYFRVIKIALKMKDVQILVANYY